jgi:hypothetical protein
MVNKDTYIHKYICYVGGSYIAIRPSKLSVIFRDFGLAALDSSPCFVRSLILVLVLKQQVLNEWLTIPMLET